MIDIHHISMITNQTYQTKPSDIHMYRHLHIYIHMCIYIYLYTYILNSTKENPSTGCL